MTSKYIIYIYIYIYNCLSMCEVCKWWMLEQGCCPLHHTPETSNHAIKLKQQLRYGGMGG